MISSVVLAIGTRRTNAELVVDLHTLEYLRDGDTVLDPTYGKGRWWRQWRPDGLITADLTHRKKHPMTNDNDDARKFAADLLNPHDPDPDPETPPPPPDRMSGCIVPREGAIPNTSDRNAEARETIRQLFGVD